MTMDLVLKWLWYMKYYRQCLCLIGCRDNYLPLFIGMVADRFFLQKSWGYFI